MLRLLPGLGQNKLKRSRKHDFKKRLGAEPLRDAPRGTWSHQNVLAAEKSILPWSSVKRLPPQLCDLIATRPGRMSPWKRGCPNAEVVALTSKWSRSQETAPGAVTAAGPCLRCSCTQTDAVCTAAGQCKCPKRQLESVSRDQIMRREEKPVSTYRSCDSQRITTRPLNVKHAFSCSVELSKDDLRRE